MIHRRRIYDNCIVRNLRVYTVDCPNKYSICCQVSFFEFFDVLKTDCHSLWSSDVKNITFPLSTLSRSNLMNFLCVGCNNKIIYA